MLIGPPGAGKSAVGPLLADRLGVEFRDTDADIGAAAGKPVGDIFIEDGEDAFRELERAAVTQALGDQAALRARGGVLALGSGAVLDPGIGALLDGLPVVYVRGVRHRRPAHRARPAPGRGPRQPPRPAARLAGRT